MSLSLSMAARRLWNPVRRTVSILPLTIRQSSRINHGTFVPETILLRQTGCSTVKERLHLLR